MSLIFSKHSLNIKYTFFKFCIFAKFSFFCIISIFFSKFSHFSRNSLLLHFFVKFSHFLFCGNCEFVFVKQIEVKFREKNENFRWIPYFKRNVTVPFISKNSVIEMMTVLMSVHLKICRGSVGERGKIHDIYSTLFNFKYFKSIS